MASDEELAKPGCFFRFLGLLLCSPSDNATPEIPHSQTRPCLKPSTANAIPTPGIVARLMGLDSLPNTSRVSSRVAPDSVPRSKSVNFVDYLLQFDPNQTTHHRRVKTSSSFREVPAPSCSFSSSTTTFQQRKNHDLVPSSSSPSTTSFSSFQKLKNHDLASSSSSPSTASFSSFQPRKNPDLVVFFFDDNDASRPKSKSKSELCFAESKEKNEENKKKKKKKISKLKDEPRRVSVSARTENYSASRSRSRMVEETFVEAKFKGTMKNYSDSRSRSRMVRNQKVSKKMNNECCSENLSPVSVLDVRDDDDFTFPIETQFSDETTSLASKRKSSAQRYSSEDVEIKGSNNKGSAHTEVNRETEYLTELMMKLRELAENDVKDSDSDFRVKNMFEFESFKEVSLVFEQKIFDMLMCEVVDELVEVEKGFGMRL